MVNTVTPMEPYMSITCDRRQYEVGQRKKCTDSTTTGDASGQRSNNAGPTINDHEREGKQSEAAEIPFQHRFVAGQLDEIYIIFPKCSLVDVPRLYRSGRSINTGKPYLLRHDFLGGHGMSKSSAVAEAWVTRGLGNNRKAIRARALIRFGGRNALSPEQNKVLIGKLLKHSDSNSNRNSN